MAGSDLQDIEESIRIATAGDVALVAELAAAAVAELTPTRGGRIASEQEFRAIPAHDSVAAAIADPKQLVLVGQFDSVGVGYSIVTLTALRSGATMAVIHDIFVLPEARELGVGETLIGAVTEWAIANECVGIDSLALPGNRATKNFFETFGLKARALTVHRSLVDDPA